MPLPNGMPTLMESILSGEVKSFQVGDRESSMGSDGGVESPVDGSIHTSRKSYESHLKEKGYHVVTDSPQRRKEEAVKRKESTQEALKNSSDFSWE